MAIAIATLVIAQVDGLLIQWLLDPQRMPSTAELVGSLRATLGEGG